MSLTGSRERHLFMVRPDLEDVPAPDAPPGFRLRTWREGDEVQWLEIIRAAYGGEWSEDAFERCVRSDPAFRPERLFLATKGSEPELLCGAAGAFQKLIHGEGTGYVHMLAVRPEFQRIGLGAALLRACLRYFRAQSWRNAVLDTGPHHAAAVRLYLGHGFLPFPETPDELRAWRALLGELGRADLAARLRLGDVA